MSRSARRAVWLCLLCACQGKPSGAPQPQAAATKPPPEEFVLFYPTTVQARSAKLLLHERWRAEVKLEGIRVEDVGPRRVRARGEPTLTLRKLRIEARESIDVTYLADLRTLHLTALDVKRFEQLRGYKQATVDVAMVTVSDDQVTFLP